MIALPAVPEVLSQLGRDPDQLARQDAVEPERDRAAGVRGAIGLLIGIALIVLGSAGATRWHWFWLLLLLVGLVLVAAAVLGLLRRALTGGSGRRRESAGLITAYLDALADSLGASTELGLAAHPEDRHAALIAARASSLFPHAVGARVDDLLAGTMLGTSFEVREIAVDHDAPYPGGGAASREAFDGLLASVILPDELPVIVLVRAHGCGPALQGGTEHLEALTTGDPAFDRVFSVHAASTADLAVLDGRLRSGLLRLAERAGTEDIALMIDGDTVHCAVADDVDMFEPGDGSLLEQLETLHDEVALCLRLVDLLAGIGSGAAGALLAEQADDGEDEDLGPDHDPADEQELGR